MNKSRDHLLPRALVGVDTLLDVQRQQIANSGVVDSRSPAGSVGGRVYLLKVEAIPSKRQRTAV